MPSPTLYMAVINDLVTDQRVDRSCRALSEAGYAVTLIGRRHPGEARSLTDRGYATQRMKIRIWRGPLFYAEYNVKLFLWLLFARTDIFYANDSDTLLACTLAARLRRKRLIFDAHELFPDVPELVDKPRVRRVWQWVERRCLPHVDVAFTVCQSVADEYRRRYGVKMTVVRNLPERREVRDARRECGVSQPITTMDSIVSKNTIASILYQGAVNKGRGVRELVDAMQYLTQCHLTVAGDGDLLEELKGYASGLPWSERVTFLGCVEPAQLHALTRQADLGVCLLEDCGLNYRYALPNRVGDFAQAGVPLLATDFPEIRRVLEGYYTGTLTEPCPAVKEGQDYDAYIQRLARTILDTLDYWHQLPTAERTARFARAGEELCWDHEKEKLLKTVNGYY